ncbi:afadin [Danio aesculapii]|uniref:afadin n=1 Tax=Danio aesculapii TaxID=1142201 RepID=UPI0024BF931F|nr:afadin [Danio aesculapii]
MKEMQRSDLGLEEHKILQENIRRWNQNHLSLFQITEPDEVSVFHGVVRFYLQDHVSGNRATKCICISSTTTTQEIIETLLEKFQHDGNLQLFPYSLYEVLENQEERRLHLSEKPLMLQLSWNKDADGRFVLRNESCATLQNGCVENKEKVGVIENFKRTLSRKDKIKNKLKKKDASESKDHSTKQDDFEGKWNLPLSITLKEKDEDSFLLAVINDINSSTIHFKLSPAYVFYLLGRFLTSKTGQRNKSHQQTEQKICLMFDKIVRMIQDVIQKQRNIAVSLAFWMANASELLNFLRRDGDLCFITVPTQNTLAQLVQTAFRYLSHRLQVELKNHLPAFFADGKKESAQAKEIEGVLSTLIRSMSLLRRCRVNPALSIQLFSQLFHFIGSWILNRITAPGSMLCSSYWGKTLRRRLGHVEAWAERQGLELAVDCHLSRLIQATVLLTMSSYSTQDAQMIQSTCYKLNSIQLRALMSKYHYSPNQAHFTPALIECVVALAKSTADVLKAEGGEIRLEEELDLHLPFLLPEDGYSCDFMRGIPKGFQEFLEPICRKGLCKLIPNSSCVGTWTVFFRPSDCSTWKSEPVKITLKKPLHCGMGVSIVAAKGAEQEKLGIFIKSVVPGGAANVDGKLNPGDQLLSVDGTSLVGVSQERAAEIMMQTGSVVTLEVVKSAAVYYGFEGVFVQPSPHTYEDPDSSGASKEKISVFDVHDRAETCVSRPSETTRIQNSRVNPKQNQKLLKKKLEYRSNPNLTYNQEMPVDSAPTEKRMLSFSTDNLMDSGKPSNAPLNTDIYQREYLTLPSSKLHSNKAPRTTEQPLHIAAFSRDQQKINFMKQARSHDDLWSAEKGRPLVDKPKYLKKQPEVSKWISLATISPMNSNFSSMGHRNELWKIPTAAQSVALSQPKRLDVPYSPQANKPSFSTFRQPADSRITSQTQHLYQCISASASQSKSQQVLKKKAVAFQPSVKNTTPCLSVNNPEQKLKLLTSELLEQEVQHLQAKVQLSLEESERLHRLSLELQFQRRIQDFQQNTDEDEDEEMSAEAKLKGFQTGSNAVRNCEKTEQPSVQQNESFSEEDRLKDGGATGNHKRFTSDDVNHNSFQTRRAPENLTFKERQRLFSFPVVTSGNVKVL